MKEQLAQEEWGQDIPTTDWDKMSQPRLRHTLLRGLSDEIPVHGPVVVFAEGEKNGE